MVSVECVYPDPAWKHLLLLCLCVRLVALFCWKNTARRANVDPFFRGRVPGLRQPSTLRNPMDFRSLTRVGSNGSNGSTS